MLLTVAGMQVNRTMPEKSASAQLTRKSKASLASPITALGIGMRQNIFAFWQQERQ